MWSFLTFEGFFTLLYNDEVLDFQKRVLWVPLTTLMDHKDFRHHMEEVPIGLYRADVQLSKFYSIFFFFKITLT